MLNDSKYVFGDQNVQVPAHLNFGKFMLNNLRRFNNEIALVNIKTGEELSYKEFVQCAVDLSTALYNFGIRKGETVAFGSETRNDFLPTVLAIIFTGATLTPVELDCGRAVLRHKLEITKPKYFICTRVFLESYEDTLKSIDSIKAIIALDDCPNCATPVSRIMTKHVEAELFEPVEVAGQSDVALVAYSSGTTGMPKGVMLTHLNCILRALPHDLGDNSMKVAWIYGNWSYTYDAFATFAFLIMGRKIVYPPEFTNEILFRNIQTYQVNVAIVAPSTIELLLKSEIVDKDNMDSLVLYSSCSLLHAKTINQVKLRFPNIYKIIQKYGSTEIGGLTSENLETTESKPGSVGMAFPGVTLKVVDPKSNEVLGPNQQGEICVRGPARMKGYIGVDPKCYLDEHGFFRTGDLGYYDNDCYFFIVGRIREVIDYDGNKIAPLELEIILQLHPEVHEAAVVGKPDPIMGELPTAFVVRKPRSKVTEEDLINHVALEVPYYMQLRGGIVFIDKIPRNRSNKILRRSLRQILND